MNRTKYLSDKSFGTKFEDLLLEYLNQNPELEHGTPLVKFKNPYAQMDFRNDEWRCELKSRRISIHSYQDLMIGANKIREAEINYNLRATHQTIIKYRFYFILKEGVYYWDFKPNPEEDDESEELYYYFKEGGRQDRGKDERKECAFIFTEHLTLLTNTIHS